MANYVDWTRTAKNIWNKPVTAFNNLGSRYISNRSSGQNPFTAAVGAYSDPYSAQINRAQASEGYGTQRYQAFPKADGGWDYFKDAKPISEQQYLAESGLSQPGFSDAVAAVGGVDDYANMSQNAQDTGIDTTTGGSGSTQIAVLNGTKYNLNDPGQFQAYLAAADQVLNSDFDAYRSRANDLRDTDIEIARAQEEEILSNIDRAMERLGEQRDQYGQDYTRSLADLAEGYKQGSARRQSFYASIAPRVYQSSQGTSQDYAQNKYAEGQERYAEDKARTDREFARTEGEYGQSRRSTENQFKLYETQRTAQAQDQIAEQARKVQAQKDAAQSKALEYSEDRGMSLGSNLWNTPGFTAQDLSGYTPSNVKLNDLMQFIKFQPAQAAQGGGVPVSQPIATPEAGGQALGTYLDYQPEQEEPMALNQYKKGTGLY